MALHTCVGVLCRAVEVCSLVIISKLAKQVTPRIGNKLSIYAFVLWLIVVVGPRYFNTKLILKSYDYQLQCKRNNLFGSGTKSPCSIMLPQMLMCNWQGNKCFPTFGQDWLLLQKDFFLKCLWKSWRWIQMLYPSQCCPLLFYTVRLFKCRL